MDVTSLFKGMVIGFSIAAPVGPIGVLCIRRTLAEGRATGLATGLGAATADAMYGAVAAFGLTALSAMMVQQRTWLALLGGLFLVYLGLRTFVSRPGAEARAARGRGLLGAYLATFALTLTNPATILSFVAVFGGLGITVGAGYGDAALLVAGVFGGSAAWWLLLSGGVGLLRGRARGPVLLWVNRVSGLLITAFGVAALLSTLVTGSS